MSEGEERLRRMVEAESGRSVPPVERVIARGRRIRTRRRAAWAGSVGAVVVLGAGLLAWPGVGPVQIVAGGSAITAAPDGRHCEVVGRGASPEVADGLRLIPDASTIPSVLRLSFAHAGQGTACPAAAGPLILIGYGPDHHTVRRTFAVWGPGANANGFGLGSVTGTESVRGHRADAYGAWHGRPVQALLWTEHGERWLATGHGMPAGELERMVRALHINPATGAVSLPTSYRAGFDAAPVVPEFAGVTWRPIWTVLYDARGAHTGQLSVTVHPVSESLDAMLRPGMWLTTVRGHRAAVLPALTPPHRITDLIWEERPGVLVQIDTTDFPGTDADLFRIAESLHPIPADDPQITR